MLFLSSRNVLFLEVEMHTNLSASLMLSSSLEAREGTSSPELVLHFATSINGRTQIAIVRGRGGGGLEARSLAARTTLTTIGPFSVPSPLALLYSHDAYFHPPLPGHT